MIYYIIRVIDEILAFSYNSHYDLHRTLLTYAQYDIRYYFIFVLLFYLLSKIIISLN